MKMTLMLCATILFCLPHLSASVDPGVIASPNNVEALPGSKKTFSCTFVGVTLPSWLITRKDGGTVSITSGMTAPRYKLPHISSIVDNGTMSQLEVTVDLAEPSLNESTYKCQIHVAGDTPVESNAATLTVYGVPSPPHVIEHGKRYRSVRVGWTKPWSSLLANVTSYQVQLLQSDESSLQDEATVLVGSTIDREKTFDNLIYNTPYFARVAAVNSVGQGPWSPLVKITTPLPDPPPPPVDIKLKVTISGGEATVTVSWTAPMIDQESQTDVTVYTIFYKESSVGDFSSIERPAASLQSFDIPGTMLMKSYDAKMTARNVGGDSVETDVVRKAAEYLQDVSGVGGLKHLIITCTFASSIDIELQCSVELAGPTAMTVMISKETSSATAVKMVSNLDPGKYNITAKAVTADGSEAFPYTRKECLIAVTTDATEATDPPTTEEPSSDPPPEPPEPSTPEPSATPTPPVAPRGTTFTTEQIGIIAGVVVGVFLALILVPCCIFSCFVIFQK